MQLEQIMQAHGLTQGTKSTPLPELTNFTATSKTDGTGIDLAWTNSALTEYVKTVIFASTTNITSAN